MNKALLLVEDNESDEKLTKLAFKRANIANELIVVRDGEEALDYLFATGPFEKRDAKMTPAIILLDLNLPRIGGLEVLRRLRKNDVTKLVPVVILTSSREDED